MPGRLIGMEVGADVFQKASALFENTITGIEPLNYREQVMVYPNPVNSGEKLTIEVAHTDAEPVKIELYDALGRLQLSGYYTRSDTPFTLDMPAVASGLYFIRVTSHRGQYSQLINFR
jgi:hypothetical protein